MKAAVTTHRLDECLESLKSFRSSDFFGGRTGRAQSGASSERKENLVEDVTESMTVEAGTCIDSDTAGAETNAVAESATHQLESSEVEVSVS